MTGTNSLIGGRTEELTRQIDTLRHRLSVSSGELLDLRSALRHKIELLEARQSEISRLKRELLELKADVARKDEALAGIDALFGCTLAPDELGSDG